jgi:protease-4
MANSIFHSAMKSFFVTLFAVFGFTLGLLGLIFLISLLPDLGEEIEIKYQYTPTILANANDTRTALAKTSPVILKIDIDGVIGTETLNTKAISLLLTESREGQLKDDRVKAILLHINSPGGTVTDSNGIYTAIKDYKARYNVPVYAFVDGMCASGGMYIACAADQIYATDISIVGSIGVMMSPFFNVTQLMEKIGVQSKTISAGKDKDEFNPFRPWKEGEDDSIKQLTDEMYSQFLNIIASNRPRINREKLIKEYGAHVFSAEKALEIGFIDVLTVSVNDVLHHLASSIGAADDEYQVIHMESKNWFSNLMTSQSPLFTGELKHEFKFNSESAKNLFHYGSY